MSIAKIMKNLFICSFLFCMLCQYNLAAQDDDEQEIPSAQKESVNLRLRPLKDSSFESAYRLQLDIKVPNMLQANDTGDQEYIEGNLTWNADVLQKIADLEPNGDVHMQNKIKSFDFQINFPDVYTFHLSTQNLGNYPELSQALAAIEKLTFKLTSTGHVFQIDGLEHFPEAQSQTDSAHINAQALKRLNDHLYMYPDHPVSVGDSWGLEETHTENGPNGISISVQKQSKTTLAKLENGTALLDEQVIADFTFLIPKNDFSPFDTLKFTVRGNGTASIDLKTGWPLEQEMELDSQTKGKMQGVEIPLPINVSGKFHFKSDKATNK